MDPTTTATLAREPLTPVALAVVRDDDTPSRFLFVGERPSPRAAAIGATWQNGRLSAKNLREAISAAGLDPNEQRYLNLYHNPTPSYLDATAEQATLLHIRLFLRDGYTVVGMGSVVQRRLAAAGVPHRRLVHPAARGAIRKTERYRAHVRAVLLGQGEEGDAA